MADASAPATAPPTPAGPAIASAREVKQLRDKLASIIAEAGYNEMWGIRLQEHFAHVPTTIILQKFVRANIANADKEGGVVGAAAEQLTRALAWRREMLPRHKLDLDSFDLNKFNGLGYLTKHETLNGPRPIIITWNLYGSVPDKKATFGNVDEFIEWRAALMEYGVRSLQIGKATEPILEGKDDPYQMIQVHDYNGISFFRMDADTRACSKKTIEVFSLAYPELLRTKYFVNVPAVMGFVFGIMKPFVSEATLRKFHPMRSGLTLKSEPEMVPIAHSLPSEYGGGGPSVKEQGDQVKLTSPPVRNTKDHVVLDRPGSQPMEDSASRNTASTSDAATQTQTPA
jgi:hypothetical protein